METTFEKFKNIRSIIGNKTILDELEQYMPQDSLSEFVEHLESIFDINFISQ